MKDKVFIAWSGNNLAANRVKLILENEYDYICCIGGNADNNSQYASIGDTVLQQIRTCNQAIIIFQNREDGSVSNNLFFELGYVFAKYGAKKVHCVKRSGENVVLPSDFDNSFVEAIKGEDLDIFARNIISYFIGRQKMSIEQNKMFLINNRYMIHDIIRYHYSELGSRCSDYELAQYILFYMQAGHMFGDGKEVENEIAEFKRRHHHEFSQELSLAVGICLSFFSFANNIKMSTDGKIYIDGVTFRRFKDDCEDATDEIVDDDSGTFDEWARVFISEQLTYAYMLYAECDENDAERKSALYRKCMKCGDRALNDIKILEKSAPCRENNDSNGLVALIRAYIYRNMFLCCQYLKDENELKWLELSKKERKALKRNYDKGAIDSKLYANFRMEYYLILAEYLQYADRLGIDKYDKEMYLDEISQYLKMVIEEDGSSVYVEKIGSIFRKLESEI